MVMAKVIRSPLEAHAYIWHKHFTLFYWSKQVMRLSPDPRCGGIDVASLVRKTSKLCGKAYAYLEGKDGDINAFTIQHKAESSESHQQFREGEGIFYPSEIPKARLGPNWAWRGWCVGLDSEWGGPGLGEDFMGGGNIIKVTTITPRTERWPRCGNKQKYFQSRCE